jgi:RHS repeat-associated protein
MDPSPSLASTGEVGAAKTPTEKLFQAVSPLPNVSLPTSGGSIRSLGEKFSANPVTGTASISLPINTSPGRTGFGPTLSLSYDSGNGNGPFGFGWSLSSAEITRRTSKGIPKYMDGVDSDIFTLVGAEDLVPVRNADGSKYETKDLAPGWLIHRYRPRVESGSSGRVERWTSTSDPSNCHWRHISAENVLTRFGVTENERITHPLDKSKIFSWLLSDMSDAKGNVAVFKYKSEDGSGVDLSKSHQANRGDMNDKRRSSNRYIKYIMYGNKIPFLDPEGKRPIFLASNLVDKAEWLFKVIFDYGEHGGDIPSPEPSNAWLYRPDAFSSYRSGFEVRTARLCRRVLMLHTFEGSDIGRDYLVSSTDFTYSNPGVDPAVYSFLLTAQQTNYRKNPDQYIKQSMPPIELEYTQPDLVDKLMRVSNSTLENLPGGLSTTKGIQLVDFYGGGSPGILVSDENTGAWFYKENTSPLGDNDTDTESDTTVSFAPLEIIILNPNTQIKENPRFIDLAGDGILSVLDEDESLSGFYKSDGFNGWNEFQPFASKPSTGLKGDKKQLVDLTGDGLADLLDEYEGRWYESLGESGFSISKDIQYAFDEEAGPVNVFSNSADGVFLADMSGDGGNDIVRIRCGEVCYWPGLGYGNFGAKIAMDNAPFFDRLDDFDPRNIILADIDGSGTTDLIYLHREGIRCYFNESGNGWSNPVILDSFPQIAQGITTVQVADLLGNGTSCLVFSSPLPPTDPNGMFYIPLMGNKKPHLLSKLTNNIGSTTTLSYAPSTKFYLLDKHAGKPWATRLPFPVQCLESAIVEDNIAKTRIATSFIYHHGYFDGFEREFRGFGMVEQRDREKTFKGATDIEDTILEGTDLPTLLTKTWFHQGIWLNNDTISLQFEGDYFQSSSDKPDSRAWFLSDTVLPDGLTTDEERDACRALKGKIIRQEIYCESLPGASKDVLNRDKVPFTVSEYNFTIQRLQARYPSSKDQLQNEPGVFIATPRESINHSYEQDITADPRITHSMTLETNKFGQALRQISVAYGKASSDPELPTDWDREIQGNTLVTYTLNKITNPVDDISKWPFEYRNPSVAETSSWEISGLVHLPGTGPFLFHDFEKENFIMLESAPTIPYEQRGSLSVVQKRMLSCTRTLFRSDLLDKILPLTQLEPLAIPGNDFHLAFTGSLLQKYLQKDNQPLLADPVTLLTGTSTNDGGYVRSAQLKAVSLFPANDDDDLYWIPSGMSFFSESDDPAVELQTARQHFFLGTRFKSPFGVESKVIYDDYDLLPVDTEDFVHNRRTCGGRDSAGKITSNGYDYRVLKPKLVTDMNLNRGEVVFDIFGQAIATAVKGKADGVVEGDDVSNIVADLDENVLLDHIQNPTSDPYSILLGATTRTIYDQNAYYRSKSSPQPQAVVSYTISRITHQSDLQTGQKSDLVHSFTYQDGSGRVIQKKQQTNSGPVSKRDQNGNIILDKDSKPIMTDEKFNPRWIGSGTIIYNSKGLPVMQYDPFYTEFHTFEPDVRVGKTFVNFYDALNRTRATLHTDGTYVKSTFDNWSSAFWDPNDTVELDPRIDIDVEEYTRAYFKSSMAPQDFQTWLQMRQSPSTSAEEQAAAQKARAHKSTPGMKYFDSMGRPFLTVAHRKVSAADHKQDGLDDQQFTRTVMDIQGYQVALRDASIQNGDNTGRIVEQTNYDMLGRTLRKQNMETGTTWSIQNIFGQSLLAWNEKGVTLRSQYDDASRLVSTSVTGDPLNPASPSSEIQISRIIFGELHPEAEARNLRGSPWMDIDQSGVVTVEHIDFKSNILDGTQRFTKEYQKNIDWKGVEGVIPTSPGSRITLSALEGVLVPLLGNDKFLDQSSFDAMNRVTVATLSHRENDPQPTQVRMSYDLVSLVKIDSNLHKDTDNNGPIWTKFVTDIQYEPDGKRSSIAYGNGVKTVYNYDVQHMLRRQFTTRDNGRATDTFQDLRYTYDPTGNITEISDSAMQTLYFRNNIVEPKQDFTYDSLYQLVEATGREHLGQPGNSPIPYTFSDSGRFGPQPGDESAMGTYREQYAYDTVGNMLSMKHESSDAKQDNGKKSWTRNFNYAVQNKIEPAKFCNQLSSSTVGNGTVATEEFMYDVRGNTVRFPHLGGSAAVPNVTWDFLDRMKALNLGGGGNAYYSYDSTDKRVRKVVEKGPNLIEERLYLRGIELFRKKNNSGDVLLERETVKVIDDKRNIALVEIRNIDTSETDRSPPRLIRYQLEQHLGSGSVELDDQAKILTYEEYSPFGSTTYQGADSALETPKRYRFAGKERDEESGFNYHGARYYIPWLARWCSADPTGVSDGTNLYIYCHCNPIVGVDVTGNAEDDFEDLRSLYNEVGEAYAGKTPPTPLQPSPTPISKGKYRQVANTENKAFRRNPPPEAPPIGNGDPVKPGPMKGKDIQVAHSAGANEAFEAQITLEDYKEMTKSRMSTVSGEAAVMDPHTGDIDFFSNHRGVQEDAILEPALERARGGGKLTPEGLKQSAEYEQWVGENVALGEKNRDWVRNEIKTGTPKVDHTITKEMIHEAEHEGADAFTKAAKKTKRGAKYLKNLGKAGGHLAAAVPLLGDVANGAMIGYELSEGDYVGAGLDVVGDVPVVGDIVDLARAANDLNNAVDDLVGTKDVAEEHGQAAVQFVKDLGGGTITQAVVGATVETLSDKSGIAKLVGGYRLIHEWTSK